MLSVANAAQMSNRWLARMPESRARAGLRQDRYRSGVSFSSSLLSESTGTGPSISTRSAPM